MSANKLAAYDGVYDMAAANLPHGWGRAVLLALALPVLIYFQGWLAGGVWIAVALAIEGARNLLVVRIKPNDPAWRAVYLPVILIASWSWIAFAALLWLSGQEPARVCAICALFGTVIYVAVNCYHDKRLLTALFAQPAAALIALIALEYLNTMPLWTAALATLSALAMLATLAVGAVLMHAGRMQLLEARRALELERDALDEKVRERTAELETAMQAATAANEAKSRFLANMSHELRTPLNAVINYAEMLQEDLEPQGLAAQCEDAERIERSGRHLLQVINDVLDVARIEQSRFELVWEQADIRAIIRDVVDTVRPQAEANGNRIVVSVAPGVGRARTAPLRLRQALINLAGNACKFTKGGLITISAALEPAEGGELLVLAVKDTGVGMNADQLSRIFKPFAQVDDSATRRAGGSGLGLVITRAIARHMGGDVAVESAPAQGSVFTLRLPLNRPAEPAMAQVA